MFIILRFTVLCNGHHCCATFFIHNQVCSFLKLNFYSLSIFRFRFQVLQFQSHLCFSVIFFFQLLVLGRFQKNSCLNNMGLYLVLLRRYGYVQVLELWDMALV